MLRTIILSSGITLSAVLFIGLIVLFVIKINRGILMMALNMKLIQITLPKSSLDQGKNYKEMIAVMEHFYSSLSGLKKGTFNETLYGSPYFTFEIANPAQEEEIIFYASGPRRFIDDVEKQIHGIFSTASIVEAEDYNIFNPKGATVASRIKLKRDDILPIRTYMLLESDPLNLITGEMTKLDKTSEGAAIQILVRPASNEWVEFSKGVVRKMRGGIKFSYAVSKERNKALAFLADTMAEMQSSKKSNLQKPYGAKDEKLPPGAYHVEEDLIKSLEEKQKKKGMFVNIRIVASAPTQTRTNEILQHLGNSYTQYSRNDGNEFVLVKPSSKSGMRDLIYKYTFRLFDGRQKMILNMEELSSLYHFSTASLSTPKVRMIRSKVASPPTNLPQEGIILGFNEFRGVKTEIRMAKNDRRRHLYLIGQTGTGKSSAMMNLIRQDIENGEGVGLIDPHGEFADYVLSHIPKERAEDLVLFEPAELQRPFGLNMLEYDPNFPEQKTFIVNELMKIFDRLYDLKATGGPMFEQYTRNALLLLMDDADEGATLMDVPRVMSDSLFRRRLLEKCKNIIVRDFWTKEAEKAGGEASLANFVPYITSKFNVFIANDFMRPIIGQSKTTLNFQDIINNKKILLVNLSKGRLGDINSSLLGLIIVGKLTMAAFSRVALPEEQRNDFYLYMDEFQNFATDSIATILSEARKYRLCLTLAHQYIGQLPEDIKNAVFGNIGSLVSFRVGPDDAQFLAKQFVPVFDENDLINIGNFSAHVKLLINNLTSPPFNVSFQHPPEGHSDIAKNMKELSQLKYGRERAIVEEEIMKKYRGTI